MTAATSDGAPPDGPPRVAFDGPVARVTLARPRQHNRIDPDDLPVLQAAFERAGADPGVRVLVIDGDGPRSFSSGYTLQAIAERLDDRFERMLDTLESLPVPTLCAIRGGVYGGGTDLALCCDLRIGTPAARMFMPAARFGLHYFPGGLRRYVTRLGLTAAKKLFLTAMQVEADEMLRIGFLTDLVPDDALEATVARHVDAIARCDRETVGRLKANLNAVADGTVDWARVRQDYDRSLRSDALRSRLDALLSGD